MYVILQLKTFIGTQLQNLSIWFGHNIMIYKFQNAPLQLTTFVWTIVTENVYRRLPSSKKEIEVGWVGPSLVIEEATHLLVLSIC